MDADVLISFKCTEDMMRKADNLKWIQALSAGVDSFPLEEIKKEALYLLTGEEFIKSRWLSMP